MFGPPPLRFCKIFISFFILFVFTGGAKQKRIVSLNAKTKKLKHPHSRLKTCSYKVTQHTCSSEVSIDIVINL